MKHLKKLLLLTLILFGLIIISCQDEINETEKQHEASLKEEHIAAGETEIVLGKKIDNPYSVANMQKAYENLISSKNKSSKALKATGETIEISTNHHYVRFWCTNTEDRDKLTDLDIKFSEFPLDYEIEQEGEFFIEEDTDIENYEGSWIYTSVLSNFNYDSLGLRYEILEDLFLFEEAQGEDIEEDESLSAKASDSQLDFFEALEEEAFRITGNLEKELEKNKDDSTQQRCWWRCRGRTQPKGRIQVYDTFDGKLVPVEGIKIRTYRWFVWGHGYTNSGGYYYINKKYRNNPRYSIDFDNPSAKIKIYSTLFSLSDATYRAGTKSKNGYNLNLYTNSGAWRYATVNNAVVKYRKYCDQYGIKKPSRSLRTVVRNGSGSSSAPMLRYIGHFIGSNNHSSVSNFFINVGWWVPVNFLTKSIFKRYLPDLTIQAHSSRGTAEVFATVFHEMAHASHFENVGSAYWAKYVSYIITYGFASGSTYGNGTGRNAGICALGEAWGYHMGYFLTLKEFGNENNIISPNGFEKFTPLQRPGIDIQTYYTRTDPNKTISSFKGWMPSGLINDIIDTDIDEVRMGFDDNVSGYTLQNIYNALDNDVSSPQDFRDRLLRENGNRDEADLRNLFEAYYYN